MEILPRIRLNSFGGTQTGKSHWVKTYLPKVKNYLVYDIKKEYTQYGAVVSTIEQLQRAFMSGCHRVIYQPQDVTPEHFDLVCKFVRYRLRNIVFIVDEVHNFCTKHKITPHFKYIVTVMQALNVGVWAITQRPANVHNDLFANGTLTICFGLPLEADAKAVCKNTGIPVEKIQSLLDRFFIISSRAGSYVEMNPL